MKNFWLHFIRTYLRIGLFFYFKKIEVINLDGVPKDKPILFLCNHQNALLDALLIATKCNRFSYFLTRAAVFKKPIVSKLLNSLQMLPVYRVRDGWSTIANNNSIFNTCSELLNKGEVVTIFPEGSHNLKRSVRPLSKGFTRIVFDTLERFPDLDLQLVPIGLNFEKPENFPDSTSIYFGIPIAAQDFALKNKNEAVLNLKMRIQSEISKLTTHIPLVNYDDDLKALENLCIDFLKPTDVNTCLASNFKDCKQKPEPFLNGFQYFFKALLIVNLLPIYLLWKFILQPKIEEIEFVSTFRFTIAVTLVPFYLIIIGVILMSLISFNVAFLYVLIIVMLSLITVKL